MEKKYYIEVPWLALKTIYIYPPFDSPPVSWILNLNSNSIHVPNFERIGEKLAANC